jgi:formyltetrahydrofolate-dependent phosphoribosylglycinamide formyltransferase
MAERPRVAILISGRGSNMSALLAAARAEDCPHDIALVFSNMADAEGLSTARDHGVATAVLDHRGQERASFDAKVGALLTNAGVSHVALAGYMRMLSAAFVADWQGRMINIHPSLLPSFPGLDAHARALSAGVKIHGCTVHFVTDDLDGGPIIAQAAVTVRDDDSIETLAARVLAEEHRIYPPALAALTAGRLRIDKGVVRGG